jgi:hypothetical protein
MHMNWRPTGLLSLLLLSSISSSTGAGKSHSKQFNGQLLVQQTLTSKCF